MYNKDIFKSIILSACLMFSAVNSKNLADGIVPLLLMAEEARIEDFPFFASLWGKCGGAIISDNWVLTAAHCVERVDSNSNHHIYVGGESLNNSQRVPVDKIIIHPRYQRLAILINDLALIKLSQPLTLSKKVRPVVLSTNPKPRRSRAVLSARGIDETAQQSEHVTKVNLLRLTTEECLDELDPTTRLMIRPYVGTLERNIICAKREDNKPSICYGDSGSPLVSEDELIGITSFTSNPYGRCENSKLGYFINVASYVSWIREQTGLQV